MTGSFKEKFDLVTREFQEICEFKISESSLLDADKETYIRFFRDCFHLKDWLRNDNAIKNNNAKNIIETYINNSSYLKFSADVANASKHKILNPKRKIRVDKDIDLVESGYIMPGDFTMTQFGKCVRIIYNEYHSINAFTLAKGCIDEWRMFIEKYKL
ncbi:TPA: hypothetical protein DD449_05025 [Candidatus Berkelbacteria bacterium]|uniref:Uncharacterized protein n=1 Tax=Berkelbacteria bacterium GW2011_GWE1_39_12 TaxID=1618337 RepID=A0A0G4B496_9BACT|nr:MAG: hypothetical protein UT28_C0001G0624 [Berkelbacteria bacterium GW2011_GWE1_39_12]HBO61016.1 hypothetical protein [Candidatus Berkelbacteria bacterium]